MVFSETKQAASMFVIVIEPEHLGQMFFALFGKVLVFAPLRHFQMTIHRTGRLELELLVGDLFIALRLDLLHQLGGQNDLDTGVGSNGVLLARLGRVVRVEPAATNFATCRQPENIGCRRRDRCRQKRQR